MSSPGLPRKAWCHQYLHVQGVWQTRVFEAPFCRRSPVPRLLRYMITRRQLTTCLPSRDSLLCPVYQSFSHATDMGLYNPHAAMPHAGCISHSTFAAKHLLTELMRVICMQQGQQEGLLLTATPSHRPCAPSGGASLTPPRQSPKPKHTVKSLQQAKHSIHSRLSMLSKTC